MTTADATPAHPDQPAADLGPSDPRSLDPDPSELGPANLGRANPNRGWTRVRGWLRAPATRDAGVCLFYLAWAGWLLRGLWPSPATRAIAANVNDQTLIEWFLSHGVLFWTGDFSLVTDRLNVPDGVNLMSNASHITHGILMAPVTVLFGAATSFAVLAVVNLAATAAGWYLVFARTLGLHRAAAFVAGAFTGFAPGMISQTHSHLHISAQWLVPPIVWCVIRLTRVRTARSLITTAVGLALLICAQVFLGEEVLYLTALTLALFSLAYVLVRPRWARKVVPRVAAALALAAGVSIMLLAYPLWVQFAGPQHVPNAPFTGEHFYADVLSYATFSPLSIAGSPEAVRLASSASELNTYFGLPLILVVLGCALWRWRRPSAVAATIAGIVLTLLSFGPYVTFNRERTDLPALYRLIDGLPVIDGALPTRYALALIPLIALLLGYALDQALRRWPWPQLRGAGWRNWRSHFGRPRSVAGIVVPVAVLLALLPTLPRPVATVARQPVPAFITTGAWRQCASEGGVIVPVPLPTPREPDSMRWPAAANAAFAVPQGFFIGPYAKDRRASLGIYPRPTSQLLAQVAKTGELPVIDDTHREQARSDLDYWNAECVALGPVPNRDALLSTLEQLLGPGELIADTWTWRVSP